MEELLAKLRKEQNDLKEQMFDRLPSDYAGVMKIWAEWNGLGKAISFIEEGEKQNERREDEDERED